MLPLFFIALGITGLSVLICALISLNFYWGFWFWESIALSGMAMFPPALMLEYFDEYECKATYLYFGTGGHRISEHSTRSTVFKHFFRFLTSALATAYILMLPWLSKWNYAACGHYFPKR